MLADKKKMHKQDKKSLEITKLNELGQPEQNDLNENPIADEGSENDNSQDEEEIQLGDKRDFPSDNESLDSSKILLSQNSDDMKHSDKLRVSVKTSNIPENTEKNPEYQAMNVIVQVKSNNFTFAVGEKQIKYHLFKDVDNEAKIVITLLQKDKIVHTEKISKQKIIGNLGSLDWKFSFAKIDSKFTGEIKVMFKIEKNIVAEVLEVEDKTISDYQYFVKTGRKFGFAFNSNIDEKMISLRKHVKDKKSGEIIQTNINDKNNRKKLNTGYTSNVPNKNIANDQFSTLDPEVATQTNQFDNKSITTRNTQYFHRNQSIDARVFGADYSSIQQSDMDRFKQKVQEVYNRNR